MSLPRNTNVPASVAPVKFSFEPLSSSTGAEPGEPAPTLKIVSEKSNEPPEVVVTEPPVASVNVWPPGMNNVASSATVTVFLLVNTAPEPSNDVSLSMSTAPLLVRLPSSVREPPAAPNSEVILPVFVSVPGQLSEAGSDSAQTSSVFVRSIEPAFVNPADAVTEAPP